MRNLASKFGLVEAKCIEFGLLDRFKQINHPQVKIAILRKFASKFGLVEPL